MGINIKLLEAEITSVITRSSIQKNDVSINYIKLAKPGITEVGEILFLGNAADFEGRLPVRSEQVCNIISIGTNSEIEQYMLCNNANVLIVDTNTDSAELFNRIQDVLFEYDSWKDKLWQVQAQEGNLDPILTIGSQRLPFPMCFFDSNLKLLAYWPNKNKKLSNDSPGWNDLVSSQHLSSNRTAIGKSLYDFLTQNTFLKTTITTVMLQQSKYLIVNLVSDGKNIGTLILLDIQNSFLNHHIILANDIAEVLFSEATTPKVFKNQNKNSFEDFLMDIIIRGDKKSSTQIIKQFSSIGYKKNQHFHLIKVERFLDVKNVPGFDQIGGIFKESFPCSRYFQCDNALYLLVPRDEDHILYSMSLYDKIFPIIAKSGFVVGISNAFNNVDSIYNCRLQPDMAIRFGSVLYPDRRIYPYEHYLLYHIIHLCALHIDITTLIHPAVKRLYECDKETGSDYVHTLHFYVNRDRNAQKTASALHIHKNTLSYRIDKIKELTGLSLNNEDRTNYLTISCCIINYLERYAKMYENI